MPWLRGWGREPKMCEWYLHITHALSHSRALCGIIDSYHSYKDSRRLIPSNSPEAGIPPRNPEWSFVPTTPMTAKFWPLKDGLPIVKKSSVEKVIFLFSGKLPSPTVLIHLKHWLLLTGWPCTRHYGESKKNGHWHCPGGAVDVFKNVIL